MCMHFSHARLIRNLVLEIGWNCSLYMVVGHFCENVGIILAEQVSFLISS